MEPHLILVTSIAPLTHPWLPGLVWTSQWWFMVSLLAPCTDTTLPMPSICPCMVGIDMHTSPWPEYQAPTHSNTHLLLNVVSKFDCQLLVIDHHSIWYGRYLLHDVACDGCVSKATINGQLIPIVPIVPHDSTLISPTQMLRCRSESVTRATRPGALTSRWRRRSYTMRYYAFCSLIPGVYTVCVCVCVYVCVCMCVSVVTLGQLHLPVVILRGFAAGRFLH